MAGPSVIRFTARLAKNGSGAMLVVPPAIGKKIGGMTKVEGTINSHPFRAPLESNGTGRYTFRVNKAMRAGADADVGDTVRLAILGPQPAPTIPADLRRAMNASKPAKAMWKELDSDARRIYIRWIDDTKNPATRARRITRTVDQLAEGKRRPCCVNVYKYMLDRVGD